MRSRRRAERTWLLIAALLLPSIFGCAGLDRIGRSIGLRDDGSIVGRVERRGWGASRRDSDARSAAGSDSVLVYLEPGDAALATPPLVATREIRIGEGRQEPQIVLVPPNEPFHFLNLDPIHHEPFSLDAPNDFRVRIGGHLTSDPIELPKSGFVRAFCGLHPTETFALVVSPASHVVSAAEDGGYAIPHVAVGEYHLRAASVEAESAAVPVRVSRGETVTVPLTLAPRGAR